MATPEPMGFPRDHTSGMVGSMCWVRWDALAAGGITTLFALRALADEPLPAAKNTGATGSYALSWVRAEGAEDCPSGRALASEVERRLGRSVFDVAAERSFEVEVTRLGGRYRSDVYVRDANGQAVGHRSLQSDEAGCGALFGATALAIALVIDPEAATRTDLQPGAAAFEPPAASAVDPATVSSRPAAAPPALQPAPAPLPRPAAIPAGDGLGSFAQTVPVTFTARAEVGFGAVPATSPGFGLAFSARPWRRWGFALSGSYTAPQIARQGEGIFELSLTRAAAAVTFHAAQSDGARFILGVGPTLGVLHLAVWQPTPITDPGDFWTVGAEAAALLQVSVIEAFFVEFGGAGAVPLLRQEFYARGQTQAVWRQPIVAGSLFFGLGTRFP